MRDIIVMLDNVYSEIMDRTPDSEERDEILRQIDAAHFLKQDLDEK